MSSEHLFASVYQCLLELSSEQGINASGKDDVYGCVFGRDSAITILKILKGIEKEPGESFVEVSRLHAICRNALLKLVTLQGKETNIESGEEPGKFVHEYRPDNYERLLKMSKPWFIYPDGELKNYDSIDSTPLCLIAIYRFWEQTKDNEFLLKVLPAVEAGLNWIITYGDIDKDYLLEYELSPNRQHGGLVVQSWTDSEESMLLSNGQFPIYPIAPVEVQGYAWLALKLWSSFYAKETAYAKTGSFAKKLSQHADSLKKRFNEIFLFSDEGQLFPAQALDGLKNQITTVTGNAMLLLWASYEENGKTECILNEEYIPHLVERTFRWDMFDADAGIRTMTIKSATYNPNQDSYHNGSFWPKLNGMSHEGLEKFGYVNEAILLKEASLKPIRFFGTPIELYVKTEEGDYLPFKNNEGQESCRVQAWSAAVTFDLLSNSNSSI